MNKIYLDHAATTKVKKDVVEKMNLYHTTYYENPSTVYESAFRGCSEIKKAKEQIARNLGCSSDEIYFTSGGSESNNWALKGIAFQYLKNPGHIITSMVEHPSVLNVCRYLETLGFEVTYLPVNELGIISLQQLEDSIKETTILISIMMANNEIGTIMPLKEVCQIAHKYGIICHTDGVQAFGHIPISVRHMNLDLFSASGHKFGGPKGIGFLYKKKEVTLIPLIHGGGQQDNLRAGTEPVALIVGMGEAAKDCSRGMLWRMKKEQGLRDYCIRMLRYHVPGCTINGSMTNRLPGNVNASFPGVDGNTLVKMLDKEGICVSTASACHGGLKTPSSVLNAIQLPNDLLFGTIRISLSYENTREDVTYLIDSIRKVLAMLKESNCL